MDIVSITDAKARLSELIRRVQSGETVCITRHGKPIARLGGLPSERRPVDIALLRSVTKGLPPSTGAAKLTRSMRDSDRW